MAKSVLNEKAKKAEEIRKKFEEKGIRPVALKYGGVKVLRSKGISLENIKDEQISEALVSVFDLAYPGDEDQKKLAGLTLHESQQLFGLVMAETHKAETGN
nr:hypothetical protein [uncultured Pseudodesulfovibrio sp.]